MRSALIAFGLAAAWLTLTAPGLARADERGEDALRDQVQRQLQALSDPEPKVRRQALQALSQLGPEARPLLRQALHSLDPEVRFYLLYLLQADDVQVERLVRKIVEGESADSGTYPSALEARKDLFAISGPGKLRMLVRLATRYGRDSAKRRNTRYVTVALDLLWEGIQRTPAAELPAGLAESMAALCELDLNDGFYELAQAFSFLPPQAAYDALRGVLGSGSPLAKARAARVLGEFVPAEKASEAVIWIAPLLIEKDPVLRRSALIALDTLPLPNEQMVPVVALVKDADPHVGCEALRIVGERRLQLAREAAEQVASEPRFTLNRRLQAVRALGLLGRPESIPALKALGDAATAGRELCVLSSWALGAIRSQDAKAKIMGLVSNPLFSQEDPLYFGLARLGGTQGEAGLEALLQTRRDTGRVISALSQLSTGGEMAVETLERFANQNRARMGDFQDAVQGLGDLAACMDQPPQVRELALESLARLFVETPNMEQRDDLLPILSRVGGPAKHPLLMAQLSQQLVQSVTSARMTRSRREGAADALARVNPAQALAAIRSQLPAAMAGRSDAMREYARSLVRSLSRAGDPSQVREVALPLSREKVEEAEPDQRAWRQNDVGIDLLYAKELDEAILEFRRMIWCRDDDYIASYNVACGYSLGGNVDASLRYLRRSIQHGYDDPRHMRTDTDLNNLHDDPRYKRLVRRMFIQEETGLPRPSAVWPRAPGN